MELKYDNFIVKKEELDEIIKIENECHITPWKIQSLRESINSDNLFIAFRDGNVIIGYYIALMLANECELLNLAVKVDYQSKGIGQEILKHLLRYCKRNEVTNIFLEVRASNKIAISLYEKNGFNELGLRKNYYKKKVGREDALLMGLTF